MIEAFKVARSKLASVLAAMPETGLEQLAEASRHSAERLANGGGVYFVGNGGSAAQAEHFAAELVGRFRLERRPLRAAALTSSGPLLTSLANDFSAEDLFLRPVRAAISPGDVLVALSTSGRSPNVLRALDEAGRLGALRLALTGSYTDELAGRCEWVVSVPSVSVERIQEAHLLLGHLFCGSIEERLSSDPRHLLGGDR